MSCPALFLEVDVICIIILITIFAKVRMSFDTETGINALKKLLLCQMIMSVTDGIWIISQSYGLDIINNIANMLFLAISGFGAMYWLLFCQSRLINEKIIRTNFTSKLLLAAPAILTAVLAATSPFSKLLFFIDENGIYKRGPLYFIQVITLCVYVFTAVFISIYVGVRGKHTSTRREGRILSSFIIFPVMGYFCQLFYSELPLANPAITLSLFMVFINLQDIRISSDALTGLNNRRRADEYIESVLSSNQHRRVIFFLADVDLFKSINDKFGHLEGDRALKVTASALRHVANEYSAFIARFGGDEFCIIWLPSDNAVSPEEFAETVREHTCRRAEESGISYPIRISIGFAEAKPGSTPTSLIAAADAALYRDKKKTESSRASQSSQIR